MHIKPKFAINVRPKSQLTVGDILIFRVTINIGIQDSNSLKRSGTRWLHLKLFNAIQV